MFLVLMEEAERQLVLLYEKHVQVGDGFAPRLPYDARLDKIFDPALSKIDKDYRQTSLCIHANFVLLERYFEWDVQNQKGLLLKQIYIAGGILSLVVNLNLNKY